MSSAEPLKYALSNTPIPARDEMQRAIDDLRPLFSLKLIEFRPSHKGNCSAVIEGRHVPFGYEPVPVAQVVGRTHPDLAQSWTLSYGFRGVDDLTSSVVSGLVWLAFVVASGGAFYTAGGGAVREPGRFQQDIEALLSVLLDRRDAYRARYPDDDEDDDDGGPVEVRSRLAD